jgi:signal transduction histidine kinase
MATTQNRPQKAYLLISLASLLPFLVIGVLRELNLFEFIELKTLDGRVKLAAFRSRHASSQIAVIAIDARSEQEIGAAPWQPYIYGSLINALQEKASPGGVGLIAWFNREWEDEQPPPGENLFVIQPYNIVADTVDARGLPEVTSWHPLPQGLTQAQYISFSRFPLSASDGISRTAQLVVKDSAAGGYRYSLEILMLCKANGVPPQSIQLERSFWREASLKLQAPSGEPIRIPVDSQGRFFVKFAGDISAFEPTSFFDALLMSSTPEQFRQKFSGKSVLIGVTAEGVYKAPTPIGEMSALALRANLLNALFNRDFVWKLSRNGNRLYMACLALFMTAATIVIYRNGRRYRMMLFLGSGLFVCHLLFVLGMFMLFSTWIEATSASLALILGGVTSGFCLAHLRLRRLLQQLQATRDELVKSEKEAVFGVMSARVRHELRNILNLIRGPAEMIRNNFQRQDPLHLRDQPEEIVREMDAIISWVTKLDEMIENELSFFQDTHLNRQRQDLEPILRSALEMTRPIITGNHIDVRLHLPPKIPLLFVDADRMRIVFANLIKNACQAMISGGRLDIEVDISQPGKVLATVRDAGTGIPTNELPYIFEPFHTTKPRGLGLGLVNVKNIVEGHGGVVCVESKVGIGTTFFIELPYV